MIKRFITLVIIAVAISSCGNTGKKNDSSKAEGAGQAIKVEFAALAANPDSYVGKNIIVEGKVIHVCTETGKKLFIVGENPNVSLYIQAGENMSKFPMDLLGSQVVVEGKITRTSGTAMASSEAQMMKADESKPAEGISKPMGSDTCEMEKTVAGMSSLSDIVMEYKSHSIK